MVNFLLAYVLVLVMLALKHKLKGNSPFIFLEAAATSEEGEPHGTGTTEEGLVLMHVYPLQSTCVEVDWNGT